jgi:diguanylate cyclase (GGDEF)-like protein/PAS domain S-box-containing protein
VYGLLRAAILTGEYPIGARLPSQKQLAARFRVATLTLRRALSALQAEGLIDSHHGRGTFVLAQSPVIEGAGSDPSSSIAPHFHVQFHEFPVPTLSWRVIDDDWVLIDANRAAEQMTHGAIRASIGHLARTLYADHPEALQDFESCTREHRSIRRTVSLDLLSTGERKDLVLTYVFVPSDMLIVHAEDQTERIKVERALRESEERYRSLVTASAEGIFWIEHDGTISFANQRAVELHGYDNPSELVGQPGSVLVAPEYREQAQHNIARTLAAGKVAGIEYPALRRDGTTFHAEVSASIIHGTDRSGTMTVIVRDVTERKRAEEEARTSAQRYRALVETSPDGIALLDMTGVILMANQQLAVAVGYESSDDLVGVSIEEHLPQDERQRAFHILEKRVGGELQQPLNSRYTVRRRDGTTFPADVSSIVLSSEPGKVRLITSTIRDVTERVKYEAELAALALHDPLTGLPNRTLLYDRLRQTLATAERNDTAFGVIVLDLDHFQEINDSFGHHVGDKVIRDVGARLTSVLRASDTLARMGGDEYAILLPDTDLLHAVQAATKLSYALEQPIDLDGQQVHVGTSMGIALYPGHGNSPDVILRCADVAMHSAKETNSGYAVYAAEKDVYSPIRLALRHELRDALQNDQLVLHYQPKMRLAMAEIDGMEALVRWNHPEHGLIPPNEFIPLAEQSGLIRPLTIWVLRNALAQCKTWLDQHFAMGVAVNLSPRSLHDLDLPGIIQELLSTSGVPPSLLTIEITESVIMADPDRATDMLAQLADLGIKLAIDDFGTGYSSLAYLRHLRVHELKIDKSFVLDLDTNNDNDVIVRSVIELGHNLGLAVVAEGVENQTALDMLAVLRCDCAQGYHLSRPKSGPEMTQWLQERQDLRNARIRERAPQITVIDDDSDLLAALQALLVLEGYTVTVVRDISSLDVVTANGRPDLFLIDIMLSGMSGIEVAEQLQKRGFEDAPMIAMSASDRMLHIAAGTDLFRAELVKPFEFSELLALCARLIAGETL